MEEDEHGKRRNKTLNWMKSTGNGKNAILYGKKSTGTGKNTLLNWKRNTGRRNTRINVRRSKGIGNLTILN